MAGAEKLLPQMAQDFEDHFGIRPLLGTGKLDLREVKRIAAEKLG